MEREEVGRVTATGDGVANVEGLPRAMANELLEFPGGVLGIAFNLDVDAIGCIVLGETEHIKEGDPVQKTGKTAIAIDTIINQRDNWASGDPKKQVKCIYVAIGQKGSTIAEVVEALEENGAMDYTVVINAAASYPASFKYVAPYAGAALGAHWMDKGEHALVIYDDLSKQADAYRELSLLVRRPPGREAYPGDVFYLHSRLLERGAKLSDELGGG